jgi:hypothetical protein
VFNRRLLVGTIVIAVIAGWFSCHLRSDRIEAGFTKTTNGNTEQQVITVMGRPSKVGKCGQLMPTSNFPAHCSKEYLYNDPFLLPQNWAIWFDENGRVVDKYYYSSP